MLKNTEIRVFKSIKHGQREEILREAHRKVVDPLNNHTPVHDYCEFGNTTLLCLKVSLHKLINVGSIYQ